MGWLALRPPGGQASPVSSPVLVLSPSFVFLSLFFSFPLLSFLSSSSPPPRRGLLLRGGHSTQSPPPFAAAFSGEPVARRASQRTVAVRPSPI
uniref:Uncharacterized protein n=1 Tax=Oryza meridionalis TaxID=40149 RepID=A0A0E0CLF7_9ORYZ